MLEPLSPERARTMLPKGSGSVGPNEDSGVGEVGS